MKSYSVVKLIFLLMFFALNYSLGLDVYLSVLPQMTDIFQTNQMFVQLTMSAFLLAAAGGQLIIGPLADQFGRKVILYFSSFLFAFGCFACIYSPSITWLIFARIVAGFGACGTLVTAFAIVRDLFDRDQSAQMYSFLNGAVGISPTFAPMLGSLLDHFWGWKSIFCCLGLLGLGCFFITYFFVKETLVPQERIKINKELFIRYLNICRHPQFYSFSLMAGTAQVVFFGFFSTSPFIIINLLHVPQESFGYYFASFGLVLCLGGFISGKLIEKFGVMTTIKIGMSLMLLGGLLMLTWNLIAPLTLASFLIPMIVACAGATFLLGSTIGVALEPFSTVAGTASAAFGFLELSCGGIGGTILMLFPVDSTLPYSLCVIFVSLLSILFYKRAHYFMHSLSDQQIEFSYTS